MPTCLRHLCIPHRLNEYLRVDKGSPIPKLKNALPSDSTDGWSTRAGHTYQPIPTPNPASISHPSFVQEESCSVSASNQGWAPGALTGRSQGKIGGNAQCQFRTLGGTRHAAFKFPRRFKFSVQTKNHRLLNPLL